MARDVSRVFQVLPYEQVGPVYFGMERKAARKALRAKAEAFDQPPAKKDLFRDFGLMLQYSDTEHVIVVAASDSEGGTAFEYEGVSFRAGDALGPTTEALARFEAPIFTDEGSLFRRLGLSFWVTEDAEDPQTRIVGVTVFGPGTFPEPHGEAREGSVQ